MSRDIANNKKARRDFHISETYEAGIQLRGTEVKSIREGKVNISDAFVRIEKLEALDIEKVFDLRSALELAGDGIGEFERRRGRRG